MRWRTAHKRRARRRHYRVIVLRLFAPNGRVIGKKTFRLGKNWRSYSFGYSGPYADIIEETRIKAQRTHLK